MPKEVWDAVSSFDWGKISEETGKKYFLSESEINDLQVEILLVLIGVASIYDLKINIESNIGTSKNYAEKIGDELLEKIFKPIADKIAAGVKNNIKDKEVNWKQNINFILSGGDYIVFLKKTNDMEKTSNFADKNSKETLLVNFLKKEDLKDKFNI
jgi:hypothetical protein